MLGKDSAMAPPLTPLPAAKAFDGDERSVLLGYLAYHRAVLARKSSCGHGEGAQVGGIRGTDVVAVAGQAHEGGVDRVGSTASSQQGPGPPTEVLVERFHLDAGQEPRLIFGRVG